MLQNAMVALAPEMSELALADGLTAFICPTGDLGRVGRMRPTDTALIWCLMTWPPEGRTGLIARLALRPAATPADIEPCGRTGTTVGIAFVASGRYADLIGHGGDYYLPESLSHLISAAVNSTVAGPGQALFRRAKCLELASEIFACADGGNLVPQASTGRLSQAEMERLIQARQMLTDRFDEKLTLDVISRAIGLNRAKLTQGFREVFGQSVADFLAEQRLTRAAEDLRSTSRPVSTIGYSAGYLNNASFARAFSKRFGICPTDFRRSAGRTTMLAAA